MKMHSYITLTALFLGGTAFALTPPPPLPRAELEAFYHATDGDQWDRNDGWLDEDTPICDWYGISCRSNPTWGFDELAWLELPANNLRGTFDEAISQMISRVRVKVDLSRNQIEGSIVDPLTGPSEIDLSYNQLTGPLPPAGNQEPSTGGVGPVPLERLKLAGNQFSGTIPDDWSQLSLTWLDLADNRLEGLPETVFLALSEGAIALRVFLENNQFTGELPASITGANLSGENSLNLCWNDLTINDEALLEWVQLRHVGGPDLSCLEQDRRLPDPELSGSWFYPPRSGEGFSLMLLDNDTALLYWFSHISRERQKWLFQVASIENESLIFDPMYRTRGIFDQGFGETGGLLTSGSRLRLDWLDNGLLHGEYAIQYTWPDILREGDIIVTPPPLPKTFARHDHARLTRLAGSRCDNGHPMQGASGAWFNEERGGEGFVVEVNDDGRGLVYWFSHVPTDDNHPNQQAWMIGDGHFEGQRLVISDLFQPRDLGDAMPEDTAGIELLDWGSLSIDFHSPEQAELQYTSILGEYGSGQYPLTRLARARLAECGGD